LRKFLLLIIIIIIIPTKLIMSYLKKKLFLVILVTIFAFLIFNPFDISKIKAQTTDDLIVEYLFPVGNLGDAIGVKVLKNPRRLSPLVWYKENVPNPGNPTYLTVDGYYAIQEGRTVYVGATEVQHPETASPEVYARIYLISYNDKARPETIKIYNQLLASWRFNINISDESIKDELRRDLLRFYDLNEITSALAKYYQTNKKYPILGAGTYMTGLTNSKWPSWQNTLAKALGKSLPIDPINKFNTDLGPCAGCPNNSNKSNYQCSNTCYNPANFIFEHPVGSHIYQYYVPEDPPYTGLYYNLTVNLEYGEGGVIWKGGVIPSGEEGVEDTIIEDVVTGQSDNAGPYNYLYTYTSSGEVSNCGDNVLGYGEFCDTNQESRTHADCDSACLGWICHSSYGNCDYNWDNGCEHSLSSDVDNCGACGNICSESEGVPANAAPFCVLGICDWECGDGYRDWDNACEPDHCLNPEGEIGNKDIQSCSVANGAGQQIRVCQNTHPPVWSAFGGCVIESCADNYADCDTNSANGCEVSLLFDLNNCGSCGNVCSAPPNATATCSAGGCQWTCNTGYRQEGNGCVIVVNTYNCQGTAPTTTAGTIKGPSLTTDPNQSWTYDEAATTSTPCQWKCESGYRREGNGCVVVPGCTSPEAAVGETGTQFCEITNGMGQQTGICRDGASPFWNWGVCSVVSCDKNYRIYNNTCELNHCLSPEGKIGDTYAQACDIVNGTGKQTKVCRDLHPPAWDAEWGDCKVEDCNSGYHQSDNECVPDIMPPSDVSAAVISSTQIDLIWTDNADNESGFKIDRKLEAGAWKQIATVSANATSYSDLGLTPKTTYHYCVKAYNKNSESTCTSGAFGTTFAVGECDNDDNCHGWDTYCINNKCVSFLCKQFGLFCPW